MSGIGRFRLFGDGQAQPSTGAGTVDLDRTLSFTGAAQSQTSTGAGSVDLDRTMSFTGSASAQASTGAGIVKVSEDTPTMVSVTSRAAQATDSGREPSTVLEIDLDYCANTYGVSPCTASGPAGGRCFNTLGTCQDIANYVKTTKTYRYNDTYTEVSRIDSINCMTTPQGVPARIVPGTVGARESITVTLTDFPWNDTGTDPYVSNRPYDPSTQGTYFGKLKARHPYYVNRPARILDGFAGQNIVNYTPANYVIDRIDGPDKSNKVRFVLKDVLTLADNKKATVPPVTTGALSGDISDSATGFTIVGSDVTEYAGYSFIRINDEVIGITYSASGIYTGVTRAQAGTTASDHSAGDQVQAVWYFAPGHPVDALAEVLAFSDIAVGFIPTAEWAVEKNGPLSGYSVSTYITEPTGVAEIANELLSQNGISMWWDKENQKIKIRAVSQFIPSDHEINDDTHILADTLDVKDEQSKRLTRVVFYYGMRDYSGDLDKPSNFSRATAVADASAESVNQYGSVSARTIFSRWYTENATAFVTLTSQRILDLYKNTPQMISFSLDARDADKRVGDLLTVTADKLQDATGALRPTRVQVLQRRATQRGHRFDFECQVVPDATDSAIVVTLPTNNLNIWNFLGQPSAVDDYEIIIADGVTIGSTSSALPAITTGNFTSGSTVKIRILSATIGGAGGAAGDGGSGTAIYNADFGVWQLIGSTNGGNGGNGGNAIEFLVPGFIETTQGRIFAGGGGGGGSNAIQQGQAGVPTNGFVYGGMGGGSGASGAPIPGGAGGVVSFGVGASGFARNGQPGGGGTVGVAGQGGAANAPVAAAGNGGNHGVAGSSSPAPGGGVGGDPGLAILTNGNTVTFTLSSAATLQSAGLLLGNIQSVGRAAGTSGFATGFSEGFQ